MSSTAVIQSSTRKNHIGQFTTTLILSGAGLGRIYGHGMTREASIAAADRIFAARESLKVEAASPSQPEPQKTERAPLADLNVTFRTSYETSDFEIVREYRVGRYGLRISRDGYGSRGVGGKLKHLVEASVIAVVKPGYNWRAYCGDDIRRDRDGWQDRVAKMHAEHEAGRPWHYCKQPKPGDVLACRQVCVDQNAVGRGAFEADGQNALDTDAIDCSNCAVRFFHETVEPRAKVEARLKAERAEAKRKNPPPTCPHCGDVRPRTKATERGERPYCSTCGDLVRRIKLYTLRDGKDADGFDWTGREARAGELRDEAASQFNSRKGRYS